MLLGSLSSPRDFFGFRAPQTTLYTPYCKIRERLEKCSFLGSTDGHRLCAALAYSSDTIEFCWCAEGRRNTLQNLLGQLMRRIGPPAFLPLLEDPAQPWKKAVFSQYQRGIKDTDPGDVPVANSGTGMGYTIRTERYRYTEWWVTESTTNEIPAIRK